MTKHTHSSHSGIELEKENKELKNVIWNLHNIFNDIEVNSVLSNSFGFGGTNASIYLTKFHE